MKNFVKINLGPILAIAGSLVLSIRLTIAILNIIFPNYGYILKILTVIFNFAHIFVSLLIIRRNFRIISTSLNAEEDKKDNK